MSDNNKNSYTPEFRMEVAELVVKHGFSIREAAKSINVSKSSVNNWVSTYRNKDSSSSSKKAAVTPEQVQIKNLIKENEQLKEYNKILKKASALLISEYNQN